jgi:putative holliday junction resolvase
LIFELYIFMNHKYSKYLGIDWGEVRIGLALGDDETKIASPFGVVSNVEEILKIIKAENIDAIVLGAPLSLVNVKYEMSDKYNIFKKLLAEKTGLPIETVDERLTSKAADALSGDKKTKAARDAVAAMLILQGYFDSDKHI